MSLFLKKKSTVMVDTTVRKNVRKIFGILWEYVCKKKNKNMF